MSASDVAERSARPLARGLLLAALAAALAPVVHAKATPKCLFVSSYNRGYPWSDGVERGLRSVLAGKCELRQFDMDTKRKKSPEEKRAAAEAARALIEAWQPDVVITADDNAAKYLIKPFYRNATTPFVFCGVNWTAKEYGFPYDNVTGIVEVAPIRPMLEKAVEISGGTRAMYVGANTLTERKNLKRIQETAGEVSVTVASRLVDEMSQWPEALEAAQAYDFVIIGSNSGIEHWDSVVATRRVAAVSRKLSVTNHSWMMPYTMLGMTKIPEEQGEWGGRTALAILAGTPPRGIPIVSNRRWELWANFPLLRKAGIKLPRALRRKAKRISSK